MKSEPAAIGLRLARLGAPGPGRPTTGRTPGAAEAVIDRGTVDASADDLVAFAIMGSAYARIIS